MTNPGFGRRVTLAALVAVASLTLTAHAQQADSSVKPGKLIKVGDILSGKLNALRIRQGKTGKRPATYQLASEPHRLPAPGGLCNLETGPQTFQIVTRNDEQVAQLKAYVGKEVSLKVEEVACAEDAGQMSEAIVSKWSLMTRH
jgi:hypothetical protein